MKEWSEHKQAIFDLINLENPTYTTCLALSVNFNSFNFGAIQVEEGGQLATCRQRCGVVIYASDKGRTLVCLTSKYGTGVIPIVPRRLSVNNKQISKHRNTCKAGVSDVTTQ